MGENYPFFFTWSAQRGASAIEITGGRGAEFTTADGARWLDYGSLSYQASLGHGHPRIIQAIVDQAQRLPLAMPTASFPTKVELAERLLAQAPDGFDRVFFALGGAEANENAIKMARLVTGRYKVAARYRSYHGATMGALSLTGDWRRPPLEPGIPGVVRFPDCYCDHCSLGHQVASCHRECAEQLGEILELEGDVGAVIVETVPGANGVLVPPPDYLPRVRELCDQHGALLIADEVLTGFGRTGRCFAFEHYGVVPDLITVAKAVTGGYASLGAVLVHRRLSAHFDDHVLVAGLTNYAQPLGCAAGAAALAVYQEEGLYHRSAALGPRLLAGLTALAGRHPASITAVRGLGLLAACEIAATPAQWSALGRALADRHIYLHVDGRRGTVIFAPPLIISETQLDDGLARFEAALVDALEQGSPA